MVDWGLRREVYQRLAATGAAPGRAELDESLGAEAADRALRELHDAHQLVLGDENEILMALPFSAVPTTHRVVGESGAWWANCAWDALAIPVALGVDAAVEATWLDTGEPVDLAVVDAELSSSEGFVHFVVPARRWWDDIVET